MIFFLKAQWLWRLWRGTGKTPHTETLEKGIFNNYLFIIIQLICFWSTYNINHVGLVFWDLFELFKQYYKATQDFNGFYSRWHKKTGTTVQQLMMSLTNALFSRISSCWRQMKICLTHWQQLDTLTANEAKSSLQQQHLHINIPQCLKGSGGNIQPNGFLDTHHILFPLYAFTNI